MDYVRVSGQDDVADFELPSDAYNDLRARVSWSFRPGDMVVDLFLAGRNLTDSEQRLHTSVVKDLAPMPGRTIEAGLRMRFQESAPAAPAHTPSIAQYRISSCASRPSSPEITYAGAFASTLSIAG